MDREVSASAGGQPDGRPLARREFVAGVAAIAALGPSLDLVTPVTPFTAQGARAMHGLIGRMTAAPGQRDALIAILLEGTGEMPGCLSYVVAKDPKDEHAIWITEVWVDQASHQASLQLPAVRAAIAKGRPMIAGFDSQTVTTPVGGVGLPAPR